MKAGLLHSTFTFHIRTYHYTNNKVVCDRKNASLKNNILTKDYELKNNM
jgi:hypothetical protein